METESRTVNGATYCSTGVLVQGDYIGAGSVGLANILYLKDHFSDDMMTCDMNEFYRGDIGLSGSDIRPSLLYVEGSYGSKQAWIREDLWGEFEEKLSEYPIFEEEIMSEIETKWENEAWDSWLKHDLLRLVVNACPSVDKDEVLSVLGEDKLHQFYLSAMESENCYPEPELDGVYIDINRIGGTFVGLVKPHLEHLMLRSQVREKGAPPADDMSIGL